MSRTIDENRKILRKYIRLLSVYPGTLYRKNAMQYLIILHNFLGLEDLFYDQCLMANKQINAHLNLIKHIRYCSTVLSYYHKLYDPNHKVRVAIETMDSIEDVRLFLASDECKDIHTKLILEWESAEFKK